MINTTDFTKRLQRVMEYYQISASGFADKIGVQRSSISHILSGRNKPSLEFIMKVLSSFPEVDLYWLLNGKGDFPNQDKNEISTSNESGAITPFTTDDNSIERIVIFFKDGSFKNYNS